MTKVSRRSILKNLAIGGTAMLVSPKDLIFKKASKKDKLGVALMGLGYYSTDRLAPALQQTKNCYLAGIITGTPSKAEAWKKKYNIADKNVFNYSNFDQIANND